MSIWDDITKEVNKLPGAGEVGKIGSDISSFLGNQTLVPKQMTSSGQPATLSNNSLGTALSGGGLNFGGGTSSASAQSPADAQTNQLLQLIQGLTYGQTQGSGAAGLAKQLSAQLQNLPTADATKVLAALNKEDPGSTLSSDITGDITPAQPSSQSQFGFDPLSLGTLFSQTLAPWLASQQKISNAETNSLASQMKAALGGASPAMQQAFSTSIPSMQAANTELNAAANAGLASGTEMDNLVAQLTNASNAYKLAQAAAANEPYVAATVQGTAVPNTGLYSTANSTLNSIMQGVLNPAASNIP